MRYQFVDCRYELGDAARGHELYVKGHVPGASFLSLEEDLSYMSRAPAAGRHPLPSAEAFAASAGRAGVGAGVFVVAYDQGMTGGAARLWWLLRHFGHEDVAVLDGGVAAWIGPLQPGEEEVQAAEFVPRPRSGDMIGAEELLERLDPVAGHIPGARNLPFTDAFQPPEEMLRADELAVYCGSGVTACVGLLALHQVGRRD